jgi:hypothetical protein
MTDTYMEWLEAREAEERAKYNADGDPRHIGAEVAFKRALLRYDAAAVERERANKALALVTGCIKAAGAYGDCGVCSIRDAGCDEYSQGCPARVVAAAAHRLGIVSKEAQGE